MLSTRPTSAPCDEGLPILDLEDLRERAGHDEDLVIELLGDFLERTAEMSALARAAEARDFATTAKLAHRMKGSLLALGAQKAARAASMVERRAASMTADDPHDLHVEIATLDACFDAACASMRAARSAS